MSAPVIIPSLSEAFSQAASVTAAFNADSRAGDSVSGTITDLRMAQRSDFATREPKFWDDGSPQLQVVITLATALRTDSEDDGKRRVYVKWSGPERAAMLEAVRSVGATEPEVGGTLLVTFTGYGKATVGNPPKVYAFTYTRPNPTAEAFRAAAEPATPPVQNTGGIIPAAEVRQMGAAPAPAPAPAPEVPAPAPAPAPAAPAPTPAPAAAPDHAAQIASIRALAAAGMDAPAIHALVPTFPLPAIAAIMNLPA